MFDFDSVSLKGMFKSKYKLTGRRDWIRTLSSEDRAVLINIGMNAMQYGRLGGLARANSAKRDSRGRFAKRA